MKLIYLACPYTDPDQSVQVARANSAAITAAKIMAGGNACYSPLSHGTAVAEFLPVKFVVSHRFWMEQCIAVLRHCDEVWVLPLIGWRQSKGVEEELRLARQLDLPINMIQDHDGGVELLTLKMQTLAEAKLNNWGILWL